MNVKNNPALGKSRDELSAELFTPEEPVPKYCRQGSNPFQEKIANEAILNERVVDIQYRVLYFANRLWRRLNNLFVMHY